MSIKRETISIEGTVIYCDGEDCGERGPQEAYDNTDDVLAAAESLGWTIDENDHDLCPSCSKRPCVSPNRQDKPTKE